MWTPGTANRRGGAVTWLPPALLLLHLPGCSAAEREVTGPEVVAGHEGGSLTVRCHYDAQWKTYGKWWCRGEIWGKCKIFVWTKSSEQLVKEDRVSIRDNQADLVFTVTMEHLSRSDEDVYWCGIQTGSMDHSFKVKVIIYPAPVTDLSFILWIPEVTTNNPPDTQAAPLPRSLLSSICFLLLVFLELPLLLSMLSAVLWVNRPQRCPAGEAESPGPEPQGQRCPV